MNPQKSLKDPNRQIVGMSKEFKVEELTNLRQKILNKYAIHILVISFAELGPSQAQILCT